LESETKLMSAEEAVKKYIKDGVHIALSGFAISRNAISIVQEIIRQGKSRLTVSQSIGGMELDLLVGAGCVEELNYSGGSLDRYGPLNCVNRAIENGMIVANEYSYLSMVSRFLAGALGLTFFPVKSLISSDILKNLKDKGEVVELTCPFTGEKYVTVKPLKPDVAVIHAQKADTSGNIYLLGPKFDVREIVYSSKSVIAVVEEICKEEQISKDSITIPHYMVSAIVHQPFGAYPTNLYSYYYQDPDHIRLYVEMSRDLEKLEKYIEEYILSVDTFLDFIKKSTSIEKLLELVSIAKNSL